MITTVSRTGTVTAWSCLFVAILAEILGTSFMADAVRNNSKFTSYLITAVALAVSYYFLSLSIRRITVGVAYAVWEGLGLTLLTLVGVFLFKESLSVKEIFGLLIAVAGIICVALGEEH
ncbi:SMR family transporter [Microvirga sp. W0021]|uniref:Spermidine export protein MdtJ n=1 Tax=Hohaiivirga grylli TaxID=3133970 RepID=A0ABV0BJT0_9HYPH